MNVYGSTPFNFQCIGMIMNELNHKLPLLACFNVPHDFSILKYWLRLMMLLYWVNLTCKYDNLKEIITRAKTILLYLIIYY